MTIETTPRTDALDFRWKDPSKAELAQLARQLERELAALRRGEFICQKCSLRKDGEHDAPIGF